MKTLLLVIAVFAGISSPLWAQGIEGRYWVNNQRRKLVVVEHYQGQDFYVLQPKKSEGFLHFGPDQSVAKGLWANFKPRKKRAVTGQYRVIKQADGSLAVTVVRGDTQWTEQWMPTQEPAR